jgi:uncharacterized membrane protein YkvI
MINFWKRYLLPGFIFQSVIIAGGYGTGREFIEFFLQLGPKAGLFAMIVAMIIWSLVCACTFALAQRFNTYDYRQFFHALLGRGWWLFEISYILTLILVLAIVVASAGSILQQTFGFSYGWGVGGLIAYVTFMVYRGSRTIEWILSFWSLALYTVYGLLFFFGFQYFGDKIASNWYQDTVTNPSWLINGVRYAGYNLALIPAVLFCLTHLNTRREAVVSGLLAGLVAIFPGILFYIIMLGEYPHIMNETVPSLFLIGKMKLMWLEIAFTIVLLGTLIETATGLIHAFNERIDAQLQQTQKSLSGLARPIIAVIILLGSLLLAQLGLVNLISKGYGWLTWLIILVYVLPALYRGIPLLFFTTAKASEKG